MEIFKIILNNGTSLIENLKLYLSYDFVKYALIVGVLISACSSLVGVTLVLKRYSFIGDGLSHSAFLAIVIASLTSVSNSIIISLPITLITSIILLKSGKRIGIKGDSGVAMLSVSTLALGYLLMNIFSKSANLSGDICSVLFGATSILTLKFSDVIISIVLSLIIIIIYIIIYNKIFSITFDEDFSKGVGVNVNLYNYILSGIIAVIIVLSINLVGSLLITAFIIFPALIGLRICQSFKMVIITALISSIVCSLAGMIISILAGTPVGASVVVVNLVVYLSVSLVKLFMK